MASWGNVWKAVGRYRQQGPTYMGLRRFSSTAVQPQQQSQIRNYIKDHPFEVGFASGAMGLSVGLGIFTAVQGLLHAPGVEVRKKKRQEIPEVDEPEYSFHKSQELIKKSIFRKVAQKSRVYEQLREAMSSASPSGFPASQ